MPTHTIRLAPWQEKAYKEGRLSMLLVPMDRQPYQPGDVLQFVTHETRERPLDTHLAVVASLIVRSCTPLWLPDITEEQAKACGLRGDTEYFWLEGPYTPRTLTAKQELGLCWFCDPSSEWESWVWAVEVE